MSLAVVHLSCALILILCLFTFLNSSVYLLLLYFSSGSDSDGRNGVVFLVNRNLAGNMNEGKEFAIGYAY